MLIRVWRAIFAQTIATGEDIDFADELKTLRKKLYENTNSKDVW